MRFNLLNSMSVRQKVWVGFGVLVALLLLVSALCYRSLFRVEDRLAHVVDELQPAMLASMDLAVSLDEAAAALGFYLLSEESADKLRYESALRSVDESLARLTRSLDSIQDTTTAQDLDRLRQQVRDFTAYEKQMVGLVDDRTSNIAGLSYAAEHLNPISQEMLQLAGEMIMSEFEEAASEKRRQLLNIIHDMRYAWANVMNGVRAYIAFRGQRSLDEINLYLDAVQSNVDALQQFGDELTLDQEDSLGRFIGLRDRFVANFDQLRKIEDSGRWRTDVYLVREELGPLVASIQEQLKRLVDAQRRKAEQTSGDLLADLDQDAGFVILLTLLGLAAGIGIAILAGGQIARPVVVLRDILKDIAQGEGDLTRRVKLASRDELGQASGYFNQTMAKLQEMITAVADASSQVNQQVSQATANVRQVKDNVSEGAEHTRSTATATGQMSATSAEIARNAETASAEADRARQQARTGGEAIRTMAARARDMDGRMNGLQQNVDSIQDNGRAMSGMIVAINEIADQTNLLALNAAIEAARAGEAGRGFAVVADEVRQLAIKTQASTAQITELLNENQRSNQELALSMSSVSEVAGAVLGAVAETEAVIGRMAGSVDTMNDMVEQIARAAREQAQTSQDITGSIEILSARQQESAALMDASISHLDELVQTANRLDAMVARFKV